MARSLLDNCAVRRGLEDSMRSLGILSVGILLVMSSGCAPNADNHQRSEEPPQANAGTAAQSPALDQSTPVSRDSHVVPSPSDREPGGSASVPFIAETKAPIPVIDLLSPGRLEVVDGCLTVIIQGSERATAVFPPGVKPELRGNNMVAVSFEGRRIPLDQEAPIPGGGIRLTSAELVRPIPSYCPKTLFGLGG